MTSRDRPGNQIILVGALSTAGGFGIRFGARFLFLVVAGQLFGAALFGAYSVAVALLETCVALASLSLKKSLFQILDENNTIEIPAIFCVMDAVLLVTGAGIVLSVLVMAATLFLPSPFATSDTRIAIFWIAPMIASQALADILFAATRWKHAVRYEVIGRSIIEPYALVGGAVLAFFFGAPTSGLIIGYWTANIALNIYAITAVRRSFGPFRIADYRLDRRLIGAVWRLLPNTGTDLVNALFLRVDIFLVGFLLGDRLAGIYGMAQQIRTPVRQVRQSFDSMLVPLVARTLARKGTTATIGALGTAARLILSIQMPLFLVIIGFGAAILGLFGRDFSHGYSALILLTAAEAIQGSSGVGDLLFVYRSPKTGFWTMLAGFCSAAAIGAIATPLFGIAGAAAGMLAASFFQAVLRHHIIHSRFHAGDVGFALSQPCLAGLAGLVMMSAVQWGVAPANATVPVLCGLLAYASSLLLILRSSGQTLALKGFTTSEASLA